METIAILNQKGGVAKTTTAHAIAAGLHLKGKSVLMVDLDGQRSLTTITGAEAAAPSAFDVLMRRSATVSAIKRCSCGDIITADDTLTASDTLLKDTGREYRLREALEAVSRQYDYCIVDCPPSLGILTINALTAADSCIVPAQADFLSLQAIAQLCDTVQTVQAYTNKALKIKGIVITRYNGRAVLSRELVEMIQAKAAELQTIVFSSMIRECIAVKEAQAVRRSIFEYAPKSNAAKDYAALVDEIAKG